MRIIIIQSVAHFDKNEDAGGGEIHLHRLASEWKKKGNEIILLTNMSEAILKIDCEGCEFEVIPTLNSEISAKIPCIIMEYHADPNSIIEKLQSLGYKVSTKKSGKGGILLAKKS